MQNVIEKPALNGVDTPTLLATINAVAGQRELARFQFRARARWVAGTHSRIVVDDFFGAGSEMRHETPYSTDADHPAVLVGGDNGPTPVELLLQGLAACLTAGIGNIAAVRGVKLEVGRVDGRGRHRPQRHARIARRSATASPASGRSFGPRRRPAGEAGGDRRAEPRPVRRLRRADQRRSRHPRGRRRLTPARRPADSAARPAPCRPEPVHATNRPRGDRRRRRRPGDEPLPARRGVEHVVLERGRVAESWRSARWDSLRLITPNWLTRLPDCLRRPRPARLHDRRRPGGASRRLCRRDRGAGPRGRAVLHLRREAGGYRIETRAAPGAAAPR